MIHKEIGNVKIHRLQVIHLYEADMGLLRGVKWGKWMKAELNYKKIYLG